MELSELFNKLTDEEKDYLFCEQAKGKELVVDNGKVIAIEHQESKQELAHKELLELKYWYNNYYTQHEQKYRRLHSLGKLTDEGKDPYSELINLYNEAEIKRARIQELERLLSENSK